MNPKRIAADHLLSTGNSIFVHFFTQVECVNLPSFLREAHPTRCALEFGYNMVKGQSNFGIDAYALQASLSFANRGWHHCVIPWGAVFCIVDPLGKGLLWDEPEPVQQPQFPHVGEALRYESEALGNFANTIASSTPERRRASFRVIDGGKS